MKYIFSDKTGTLTRNIMEFKKFSVGGKMYEANVDQVPSEIAIIQVSQVYSKINFVFKILSFG